MIKGIVLDVDGVLIGDSQGFNFPNPHSQVIHALSEIRKKGVPIVLCTGKGGFAIEKIVKDASLSNPHIADAGASIINPLLYKAVKIFSLEKKLTVNIIASCIQHNVYIEVYGLQGYYVQKNQVSEITQKHSRVLQKNPQIPLSLADIENQDTIVKLIAVADNDADKKRIGMVLEEFKKDVTTIWTIHPSVLPYQFCLITAKEVSKKSAVQEVFEHMLTIPLSKTLGIGDTMGDWNFMQLCGNIGVMGNAPEELKDLARNKEGSRCYIGPSVEQNGILDIFRYFEAEMGK